GADYRAERLAGAAATTLVLTDAPGGEPLGIAARGPAPQAGWIDVPISPAQPENQADYVHLPLPVPAHAVTALRIAEAGLVEALVKTSQGHLLIQGRIPVHRTRTPIAATAYPLMHGDGWQLRIIITQERNGYGTS
ncbi:MAG TPA: hypothetical protein VD973_07215, partial [Symbiobacteriaceae bacterium]|nr:hypothetical protein [Symbiobacteriaceae bacterium]